MASYTAAIFQLADFGLEDMLECSTSLRAVAEDATSMEQAASAVVHFLRESFIDKDTGQRSLALVRFYKVLPFERLEEPLQAAALAAAPHLGSLEGVPCLTLLATAGQEPSWNDRLASWARPAFPLPDATALGHLPMVSALITRLGLDPDAVVHPSHSLARSFGRGQGSVFFVPEALGSPDVPAQQSFVIPYGIRSVVGAGGVLPSGGVFALVVFSTTPIPPETAEAFSVIAVSAKVAVLPFVEGRVFDSDPPGAGIGSASSADRALRIAESQVDALRLLLEVREAAIAEQSTRLNLALEESHRRAEELAASQVELASSEARTAAIVSGALDCIISMGADGRVLEFNPAAQATFGYQRHEVIGRFLADLIIPADMRERHTRGLERYLETGEGALINRRVEVSAVRRDGTSFPVELTITPVVGADPPSFTGYIRDITERRRAQSELLRNRERLMHMVRTLQSSLLPPVLPDVPGLELASVYRPAGDGNDVGGDFYDVFELSETRWALVLGDVCGKGPEAAAITALVRYTLRAAAFRNPSDPAAVLAEVHQAIERQRPDTFCTVVYAVVQPWLARAEIVLGGHPAALHVTPAGDVKPVGGRGPLLGLADRWAGHSQIVALSSGDTLVLYSDGVTEARRGDELFGAARLAAVVAERTATASAHDLVAAIDREVVDFAGRLGDDMAVLAARLR